MTPRPTPHKYSLCNRKKSTSPNTKVQFSQRAMKIVPTTKYTPGNVYVYVYVCLCLCVCLCVSVCVCVCLCVLHIKPFYLLFAIYRSQCPRLIFVVMRQGRRSEATETVAKKPLHNGSYEHRVPKIPEIQNQTFFCTRDVYLFIYLCDSTS